MIMVREGRQRGLARGLMGRPDVGRVNSLRRYFRETAYRG
jgi:hypothetical protein